jgi:hypothetical protein
VCEGDADRATACSKHNLDGPRTQPAVSEAQPAADVDYALLNRSELSLNHKELSRRTATSCLGAFQLCVDCTQLSLNHPFLLTVTSRGYQRSFYHRAPVDSRVLVPQVLQHLLLCASTTHAVSLPLTVKLPAAATGSSSSSSSSSKSSSSSSSSRLSAMSQRQCMLRQRWFIASN